MISLSVYIMAVLPIKHEKGIVLSHENDYISVPVYNCRVFCTALRMRLATNPYSQRK